MEDMIKPVINPGVLQCQDVLRLFYDAELVAVTLLTAADGTGVSGSNIKAGGAKGNLLLY